MSCIEGFLRCAAIVGFLLLGTAAGAAAQAYVQIGALCGTPSEFYVAGWYVRSSTFGGIALGDALGFGGFVGRVEDGEMQWIVDWPGVSGVDACAPHPSGVIVGGRADEPVEMAPDDTARYSFVARLDSASVTWVLSPPQSPRGSVLFAANFLVIEESRIQAVGSAFEEGTYFEITMDGDSVATFPSGIGSSVDAIAANGDGNVILAGSDRSGLPALWLLDGQPSNFVDAVGPPPQWFGDVLPATDGWVAGGKYREGLMFDTLATSGGPGLFVLRVDSVGNPQWLRFWESYGLHVSLAGAPTGPFHALFDDPGQSRAVLLGLAADGRTLYRRDLEGAGQYLYASKALLADERVVVAALEGSVDIGKTLVAEGRAGGASIVEIPLAELVAVEAEDPARDVLSLEIYPNPFSDAARFRLQGLDASHLPLRIDIYDVLGRRVASIPASGEHLAWRPVALAGGVYIAVLKQGGEPVETATMLYSQP